MSKSVCVLEKLSESDYVLGSRITNNVVILVDKATKTMELWRQANKRKHTVGSMIMIDDKVYEYYMTIKPSVD